MVTSVLRKVTHAKQSQNRSAFRQWQTLMDFSWTLNISGASIPTPFQEYRISHNRYQNLWLIRSEAHELCSAVSLFLWTYEYECVFSFFISLLTSSSMWTTAVITQASPEVSLGDNYGWLWKPAWTAYFAIPSSICWCQCCAWDTVYFYDHMAVTETLLWNADVLTMCDLHVLCDR